MSLRKALPVLLVLSALSAFGIACNGSQSLDRDCEADAQCEAGATCHLLSGRCLSRSARTSYGIEVLPPTNNQGWVRQEFTSGSPDLQLEAAVSLQGIVHTSDATTPLAARVRVWRSSLIAGRPAVIFETATPDHVRQSDDYLLWLTRNSDYALFVTPQAPNDATYPPALESGLHLDDHTKKDVVLDGADRSAEVTGRVVDAAGSPLPYSVHVRAFHEGGWLRSTPALTCSSRSAKPCPCSKDEGSKACDGVFSFRIPYGVHNYTVMVEPPPADANTADPDIDPTAIPTLTCTGAPFGIFQPGEKISIEQPLRMPAFAKSRDVELKVESVDDTAVVGAQVIFETDFEVSKFADIFQSCTATYRRSGTTNADGKVTLSLLPGGAKNRSYRLTVVSPQTSPYASIFRSNFEIGSAAGHISVRLDQRYELRGEVIDSLGNGLADTHVEAQGFSPLSTTKNDIHPTTVFATTDAHGAFVLHVDPGSFHLHFVPLPSSAAPRFSALSKTVSGSVAGLVFTAPAPSLLDGRVLLPVTATRSLPMGAQNFTVNAYETIPRSESHSMAVLRGTTIVDDAGAYRLLVPAP